MAPPRIFKNYINGEWVPSASGLTFDNSNPADRRELVGMFQKSSRHDVEDAIQAAKDAYKTWRLTPPPKRGEILYRAARLLSERKEEYASQMTREMGKVIEETRGDVQEAIDMTYYMAGEGRRLFGQTTPSELPNKMAMSVRQPHGVCAMVTPWNFPMAIPSWKMMPALVSGNSLVIKPASDTPLSTYNLAQILTEAGIPAGVVNVVNGSGAKVGVPLVNQPKVRAVSFTGSTEVGRTVSEACARDFRPCHLEMGGKNIIVVMDDANLDLALDGAIWGSFGTSGQRCTATSRIAVQKRVYRAFVDKLAERARTLRVGDGLDPATEMGPLISESQLRRVMEYVEIGVSEGAKLVAGGKRLASGRHAKGWFHEPTVLADCAPKMRVAQEEVFGPVVAVMPFDTLEDALDIANGVVYGLSASIYTRDVNKALHAARDFQTGIVYVNAPTIGAETHLPFGGTKQTGNGHREASVAAIDFYTEWKTIYVDYSDRLQRAQIDTASFGSLDK